MLIVLAGLAIPSGANAATYCVQDPTCVGAQKVDLAAALTASNAAVDADTIKIGPGTFELANGLAADLDRPVTIVGSGVGATIMHETGLSEISIRDGRSSISNLDIDTDVTDVRFSALGLPVGAPGTWNAHDMRIYGTGYRGIQIGGNAKMSRVRVDMRLDKSGQTYSHALTHYGNSVAGDVSVVEDSFFRGELGVYVGDNGTLRLNRSTVEFSGEGINVQASYDKVPTAEVSSVVLKHVDHPSVASSYAVYTKVLGSSANSANATVYLYDVTVAGNPGFAISSYASGAIAPKSAVSTIYVDGLAVDGHPVWSALSTEYDGAANTSEVYLRNVSMDTAADRLSKTGGGNITLQGGINYFANPGFVDAAAGDFRLLGNSPLIDAGSTALDTWESTTDLEGRPRPVWGNGSTAPAPRLDLGAFEYNRLAPTAIAGAVSTQAVAGSSVTLTGSGSDANAGEASQLTYAWSLPGGATAAVASPTFATPATPGTYTASLVVTDLSGASSAPAPVSITVTTAPVDTVVPRVTLLLPVCARTLTPTQCARYRTTRAAWRTLRGTTRDYGTPTSGVARVEVAVYRKYGLRWQVVSGTRVITVSTLARARAIAARPVPINGRWTRTLPVIPAGTWTVRYRAVDRAGNRSLWAQRIQPMS